MESSLKNMVLVLGAITLVAGGAVGMVYNVTKQPIADAKVAKTEQALKAVLPQGELTLTQQQVEVDGEPMTVNVAENNGEVVGYAVQTSTKAGFGGEIVLMAGFTADGKIIRIETLQQTETPGLGDKMVRGKSDFPDRFDGKQPTQLGGEFRLRVKKDGGDVDAITAATISSRAFSHAVAKAATAVALAKGEEPVDAATGATSQLPVENQSSDANTGATGQVKEQGHE